MTEQEQEQENAVKGNPVELNINPAETATLINVVIGQLDRNPYRDMTMFPIQQAKVESLIESIEKTGYWAGIIARPVDNEIAGAAVTQEELTAMIDSGADLSEVNWQIAFGHHRMEACTQLGFHTLPIIPQIVTDERMLLMMANENKEGFGSNLSSTLETVNQVKKSLEDSIQDFDTYEEYCEAVGADPFFTSSKALKSAQENGVGFKVIKRFLGETWPIRLVRAPVAILKAVEKGYFLQEAIVDVPSMSLLEKLTLISNVIYEGFTPMVKDAEAVPAPNWPLYFKEACIDDIIERCSLNADKGKHSATVTVGQLDKARKALQDHGVNPASYLRSGKGKTAFDIYEATKEMVLIADKDLAYNLGAIADLKEHDGFADYDGLDELITKLNTAAERLAKGEDDTVEEGEGLDPTTAGDVDAAINAGVDAVEGEDSVFGEVEEGVAMPINQLVLTVAGDCEIMGSRIDALLPRIGEFEADDTFTMAVQDLLNKVSLLAMGTVGKVALTEAYGLATAVTTENDATIEVSEESEGNLE